MCPPSWNPSHLPPCPIPQCGPSAPALSAMLYSSHPDWRSTSHTVNYIFQRYSLKSSHPHLLPRSPKFGSLHLYLFCCFSFWLIYFTVYNRLLINCQEQYMREHGFFQPDFYGKSRVFHRLCQYPHQESCFFSDACMCEYSNCKIINCLSSTTSLTRWLSPPVALFLWNDSVLNQTLWASSMRAG